MDISLQYYIKYAEAARKCTGPINSNSSELFQDFHSLLGVCAHPWVVKNKSSMFGMEDEGVMECDEENSLSDESTTKIDWSKTEKNSSTETTGAYCKFLSNQKIISKVLPYFCVLKPDNCETKSFIKNDWWIQQFHQRAEEFDAIECSGKLTLLFSILADSGKDKVLVFSQSLHSLSMIEHFLPMIPNHATIIDNNTDPTSIDENSFKEASEEKTIGKWEPEVDYFRLDGKTKIEARKNYCDRFNDVKNSRARCVLKIS